MGCDEAHARHVESLSFNAGEPRRLECRQGVPVQVAPIRQELLEGIENTLSQPACVCYCHTMDGRNFTSPANAELQRPIVEIEMSFGYLATGQIHLYSSDISGQSVTDHFTVSMER